MANTLHSNAAYKKGRGFADDMPRFFGGRKKKFPPITEREKTRLIREYIRIHGVTRCPDGWAEGLDE